MEANERLPPLRTQTPDFKIASLGSSFFIYRLHPMSIFLLLAIPMFFYLLPALVPIWCAFLIVWPAVGILIFISWYELVFRGAEQDQLALLFDKALIYFLLNLWVTAALVQLIRGLVRAKGYRKNYHHWLVVAAGGFLSVSLGISAFFTNH